MVDLRPKGVRRRLSRHRRRRRQRPEIAPGGGVDLHRLAGTAPGVDRRPLKVTVVPEGGQALG